MFQAKIRRSYNWYRSMTLGDKREPCKWDQLHIVEGLAMVNAFHDPEELCIVMEPYFLLEPYTFDSKLPKFWNYAIHSTLGHELGHGFEVGGTKRDTTGISGILCRVNQGTAQHKLTNLRRYNSRVSCIGPFPEED